MSEQIIQCDWLNQYRFNRADACALISGRHPCRREGVAGENEHHPEAVDEGGQESLKVIEEVSITWIALL